LIREGDRIFRTYFINNRGDEQMGNTWNYLDITALGRQETWEDSPQGYPQTPPYQWWNARRPAGPPGELRTDLSDDDIADIIWSMNGPEYWTLLVSDRGWSPGQFGNYLTDAWQRLFLARAARPPVTAEPLGVRCATRTMA